MNIHNKHLQNNLKRNNMKDLDKDYIYDLSDLNKEERTELMKDIIGYSRQIEVLKSVLNDYDLRKLTLQCEK